MKGSSSLVPGPLLWFPPKAVPFRPGPRSPLFRFRPGLLSSVLARGHLYFGSARGQPVPFWPADTSVPVPPAGSRSVLARGRLCSGSACGPLCSGSACGRLCSGSARGQPVPVWPVDTSGPLPPAGSLFSSGPWTPLFYSHLRAAPFGFLPQYLLFSNSARGRFHLVLTFHHRFARRLPNAPFCCNVPISRGFVT